MFGLGAGEVIVVLAIALIFIGPKKLPGLAKGLGKGLRDFQNAVKGIDIGDDSDTNHTEAPVEKIEEDVITVKQEKENSTEK